MCAVAGEFGSSSAKTCEFAAMKISIDEAKAARAPGRMARFLRDERGSYIMYMALLLPAMIGIAGLGSEGVYWLYKHRFIQSAADNAAFSAATDKAINSSATTSDLLLQAKAIAANDYGLVSGSNGVTVTMNRPPVGTCYSSSQYI